ncbi:MarR family winged helix-turn-helix transcriptional regulator [Hoyosella subflava]|uniref:Transcriptional regulator, MarR family n=1 Tax=Hoyosella subflava (strain DSM 45089 / JCM 17490 / NBRC 109087 / DQS3-9A1) TaxID=443218 RepID=F6ELQ7_HOYSD|nr:MarR family transcriptional regulator [Hoyosella subflava]AEF41505.1 Transcriptional regulator, MarR family [Hoyosella subflava DQS3-9A1]
MTTRDLRIGFRVSNEFIADNPDVDASAVEVSINFMAVSELASSRMESLLAPLGLRKGGYNLLMVLAGAEGPITPTQIGERIVARGATITGLVNTLVRRGYAERAPDPNDRRRVLVSITPSGRDVVSDASAVICRSDEELMGIFSEDERERLIRMLGRLQNHLKKLTT